MEKDVGTSALHRRHAPRHAGDVGTAYGLLVVVAGVAANLLIAAMFIARVTAPERARTFGFAGTAMAVPLAAAAILALARGAEIWDVALPVVFVVFAVVEVLVDAVLDLEVRTTRWLWPYLMLFYLAQWAVIGAAFRAGTGAGFAVLVSYFVCLAATAWSYRKVGHGVRQPAADPERTPVVLH